MIQLSRIITNVRIRHESESDIRWSDAAIQESINEGLDDLSEVTRFYERHVTVPFASLRTYYDLRGFLPETALGVTSIWNGVREHWLDPKTPRELGSRWEQATGSPQCFFTRGLFWVAVWPKPETTVGFMKVYFVGQAPHYTHPQAVLMDLLDDMVPALEEYALYDLAAQDGESERALFHWADYSKRNKVLADEVNRRIVTPRVMKMGTR